MNEGYLFVYGTLRRRGRGGAHPLLGRDAELVGEAVYRGRLFRVGDYPGAVPSDDPAHRVHGEVYRLPNASLVLPELDRYEECGPDFPEPAEYVRLQQEVSLPSGKRLLAWVYLYNRGTDGLPLLSSGDFLEPAVE